MAQVRFQKGSEEWLMFMDYWNLCQNFWKEESGDDYWQSAIDSANAFITKYAEIPLAKNMAIAFLNTQEHKLKNK